MPETGSKKRKEPDVLTTRTGGAYIPPAKLRLMQKDIQDKSSAEFQRLAWEQLKKSINGLINKVNTSNLTTIVRELIKQNLVRGRGLLCRSIMQAQSASQTFTNVYAALVSILNSKFPNIGELLLKRLVIQFRRGYKRNDKPTCLAAAKFIAHLVNQQVAHEVLALEILTLLLEHPTEDSVEVAVAFLKEVGARLEEVSPRGAHAIFERLRHVLHEGHLEKRVQYMIEVMFQVRKDKFKDFPTLPEELDLVEEEDQFTHLLTLDEITEGQDILNVFKVDEEFVQNEDKYATLRKEILDESEEEGSGADDDDAEDEEEEDQEAKDAIIDKTETNMLALRRTIYLTIQSSLDFEECCHKILRLNMKDGQEIELCHMILDCCAQQRTYEKFFGLLAQRFCNLNIGRKYIEPFQQIFKDTYDTVHRLDTNKLRNVGKFFAHLLFTDAISWTVLEHIKLTEDETTSSSRIFIKILMQELSEYMGLQKLNQRLQDPTLVQHFEGLFPRDHPKNTRFSINFFTSIGLGGLTDELREFLKKQPKPTAVIAPQRTESPEASGSSSSSLSSTDSSDSSSSSSDSDSSSGSSSDSSSGSSSSSSSDSSESEDDGKKKKKKKKASGKVVSDPKRGKGAAKQGKSAKSKSSRSRSPAKELKDKRGRKPGAKDTDKGKRDDRKLRGKDQKGSKKEDNPRDNKRKASRSPNKKGDKVEKSKGKCGHDEDRPEELDLDTHRGERYDEERRSERSRRHSRDADYGAEPNVSTRARGINTSQGDQVRNDEDRRERRSERHRMNQESERMMMERQEERGRRDVGGRHPEERDVETVEDNRHRRRDQYADEDRVRAEPRSRYWDVPSDEEDSRRGRREAPRRMEEYSPPPSTMRRSRSRSAGRTKKDKGSRRNTTESVGESSSKSRRESRRRSRSRSNDEEDRGNSKKDKKKKRKHSSAEDDGRRRKSRSSRSRSHERGGHSSRRRLEEERLENRRREEELRRREEEEIIRRREEEELRRREEEELRRRQEEEEALRRRQEEEERIRREEERIRREEELRRKEEEELRKRAEEAMRRREEEERRRREEVELRRREEEENRRREHLALLEENRRKEKEQRELEDRQRSRRRRSRSRSEEKRTARKDEDVSLRRSSRHSRDEPSVEKKKEKRRTPSSSSSSSSSSSGSGSSSGSSDSSSSSSSSDEDDDDEKSKSKRSDKSSTKPGKAVGKEEDIPVDPRSEQERKEPLSKQHKDRSRSRDRDYQRRRERRDEEYDSESRRRRGDERERQDRYKRSEERERSTAKDSEEASRGRKREPDDETKRRRDDSYEERRDRRRRGRSGSRNRDAKYDEEKKRRDDSYEERRERRKRERRKRERSRSRDRDDSSKRSKRQEQDDRRGRGKDLGSSV